MYIPVANSPCAVKRVVEESRRKKKPRAGTRGRRDRDLNRRHKSKPTQPRRTSPNEPGALVKSHASLSTGEGATEVIDLEALRFLPPPGPERQELEERIGSAISLNVKAELSPADLALLQTRDWKGRDPLASARIGVKLDRAILDRAPSIGPHLFLSPLVMDTLTSWRETEPDGPELFDRLGKALKRGALARRNKKATLPVQSWMPNFKEAAQEELKALQQLLKVTVLPRQRRWTGESLRDAIADIVHSADRRFPVLLSFWGSFQKLPAKPLAQFCYGQIGAAKLADNWIAGSLNRDAESVRQDLSAMRSKICAHRQRKKM